MGSKLRHRHALLRVPVGVPVKVLDDRSLRSVNSRTRMSEPTGCLGPAFVQYCAVAVCWGNACSLGRVAFVLIEG